LKGNQPGAVELPGYKRSVKELAGDSHVVMASQNKNDPNSATVLYVQTGSYIGNVKGKVYQLLLVQFLGQPFFADLRTQQQLGYLVSASSEYSNGMAGVKFRVQSANTPCHEVQKRILKFFTDFNLDDKSEADFQDFKQGLISKLKEKPKRLNGEFTSHWVEVSMRTMNFGWRTEAIQILEALQFDVFKDYLADFKAKPKLWLHVVGPESVGSDKILSSDDIAKLGGSELDLNATDYRMFMNAHVT